MGQSSKAIHSQNINTPVITHQTRQPSQAPSRVFAPHHQILHLQRVLGNQAIQRLLITNRSNSENVIRRQNLPGFPVKRVIFGENQMPSIMHFQLNALAEQANSMISSGSLSDPYITIGYLNTGSPRFLGPNDPCRRDLRFESIPEVLKSLGIPANRISIVYPPPTLDAPKSLIAIDLYNDIISAMMNNDYIRNQGSAMPVNPPPAVPATNSTSLSDLLTIKFNAGDVLFEIELPKSLTVNWPVSLGGARTLSFEIKAETSGTFSFAIIMNEVVPYFRVSIKAGVSYSEDNGTSGTMGITFDSTRTTYQADNPEKLKENIIKAGEKLKTAYDELRAITDTQDRLEKLADIAGAIGEMYTAIESSKAAAVPTPRFSFSLGAQTVLVPGSETYSDPDPLKWPADYLGGTFTWRF